MSTVLIIEDENDHRLLLNDILRDADFDTRQASSTAEAERILESEKVDLIILDHGLPETRGADWYHRYIQQQFGSIKKIPVLFVSVFAMSPEIRDLLGTDRVMVLAKPLLPRDLVAAAKKLVAH